MEIIDGYAFYGCSSLKSVTLPKSLNNINHYAFYNCVALEEIAFPEGTDFIDSYAFSGCVKLNSVAFADSITAIKHYAFYGCSALSVIDLPSDLTSINDHAFSGCSALTSVKLYDSLTLIGDSAFSGCTSLSSIDLPDSLITISGYVFNNCTSLSSLTLPDSITSLGAALFYGCTSLTEINIPMSLVNSPTSYSGYGVFSGSSITDITIPDGMTKIPYSLFYNHTALTEITIPDSVEIIDGYAFYGCSSLKSVNFPKSLTKIEYYAFGECDSLKTLVVPKSVTAFNENALYGSDNVTVLCYSNSAAHLALDNTNHKFILIDDHEHDYTVINEIAATCTQGSYKESLCNICNYVLIERTDPNEHNMTSEIVAPTCQDDGYTLHVCSACGYSYKDNYTNAISNAHKYSSWEIVKDATIFDDGLKTRSCSVCNKIEHQTIYRIIVDASTDENYGYASFKVVHAQTLLPINEAQIFVSTDEGEHTFFTDENGEADIVLPVGRVSASFIAEGCLVRSLELDVKHGSNEFAPVGLSELKSYDVNISSRIMTLDEIIAAGIDVTDPANQHIVEYELKIQFKSEIDYASILAYFNSEGICIDVINAPKVDVNTPDNPDSTGDPAYTLHYHVVTGSLSHSYCEIVKVKAGESVRLDYTPERNSKNYVFDGWYSDFSLTNKISTVRIQNLETTVYGKWVYVGEGEEPTFNFGNIGISFPLGDETLTVYPASENFYLIVRGEVRWLKEMFDVEMLVVNNSMTDTLENLTAKLSLPEGLSLPDLFGEKQSDSKYVGNLGHGESKSVHWYVRGDSAGSYSLTANLKGKMMPFNEQIDDNFVSEDNLYVYAGNALHLNFSFPAATYTDDDYPMVITLTNVSDITLYNVHNLFCVKEGMVVYYSDGTTKEKWKVTTSRHEEVKEFKPQDQLIIELSTKIFFNSEIIEEQIEKYTKTLNQLEKLWNSYKAAKEVDDRLTVFFDSITGYTSAIEKYTESIGKSESKTKLLIQLIKNLKDLKLAVTGSKDDVSRAVDNSATGIVVSIINAVSMDPDKWIEECKEADIKSLSDAVSALARALVNKEKEASSFNVFDSLRTAISAIPIKFAIESVVMIPKGSNTTVIPWSYTATPTDVRYFGVSNVSSYIISLTKAIAGTYFDGIAPVDFINFPLFDDMFDMEESEEIIRATEKKIESFKVSDATGNKSFKAWIEKEDISRYDLLSSSDAGEYVLFSDNDSAVFENGVLTFRGGGWVYFVPSEISNYTLYIEDDDGTVFTYHIEVVGAHTCTSGDLKTMVYPSETCNGFAVEFCTVCDEIMDIIILKPEDICKTHSFDEWQITIEATCTEGGIRSHTCAVCGFEEMEIIPSTDHKLTESVSVAPTCTEEGYTVHTCLCGEVSHTESTASKTDHSYGDNGICEVCGASAEKTNATCDCKCHRRGLRGFIWRIGEFFRRLFGRRHVCECTDTLLGTKTMESLNLMGYYPDGEVKKY